MRSLVVVLLACLTGQNASGQCPVQLRQASSDATRKNVTIRYYNSSPRAVRDVQFVLTTKDKSDGGQSAIGNFSARSILHPNQERTVVFPNLGAVTLNGTLELLVKRVSFADRSTWAAPRNNACKIQFNEP
jgi:hypothetical protein